MAKVRRRGLVGGSEGRLPPRASLLRVLAVLALLTGLFGMHVLTTTDGRPSAGSAGHALAGHVSVSGVAAGHAQGGHATPGTTSAPADLEHSRAGSTTPMTCCSAYSDGSGRSDDSAAIPGMLTAVITPAGDPPDAPVSAGHAGQLCLAVLAAGLAMVALLLASAPFRAHPVSPPSLARLGAAPTRYVPPGPTLAALSLLRI